MGGMIPRMVRNIDTSCNLEVDDVADWLSQAEQHCLNNGAEICLIVISKNRKVRQGAKRGYGHHGTLYGHHDALQTTS